MDISATPRTALPSARSTLVGWIGRLASNYLFRRILKALFTILFVTTLTFFIIRLMPSSPIDVYIDQLIIQYSMSYDEARNQAAALFAIDLSAPLHVQYFRYIAGLMRGDLGTSLVSPGTSVSSIIARFLPWTLFSVGTGLLISFTLGIALGMIMAYRRESTSDHVLSALASLTSSVPNYLVGIMLLVFLGVQWDLLPIQKMRGSLSPGVEPALSLTFIKDAFFHAALPIVTYVLTSIGGWMLTMKSSTISTLEEDYVTVARARGLSDRRIATAYVGRNASLPLFTQVAVAIGFVVGGSILIEYVFVYQGIGLTLLNSINQRDYTVMQGIFLVITISVILSNLLADLLYSKLDPRITLSGEE